MNSKYNYFITNEPNFQTINEWENDNIELELLYNKPLENSQYFEQHLKPVAGLDFESDFLKTFKSAS